MVWMIMVKVISNGERIVVNGVNDVDSFDLLEWQSVLWSLSCVMIVGSIPVMV